MENVRTVVLMGEQRGSGEDLFRCKETGKVYIRQECDNEYVRWLTSSKWSGGYEADCPMKEGLEIRISDKAGNVLFVEKIVKEEGYDWTVAKKEAPFSWNAILQAATEIEKKFELKSHDEWKDWILADREAFGHSGYWENWAFGEVDYGPVEKIESLHLLGQKVLVTKQKAKHRISKKEWTDIEIRTVDLTTVLEICGYMF